jgi:branched-chain amino acid aminotransferase
MKIYLNGKFVPKEKAVVSVFDHGLLYGDGIFEGIRAYNGRVFLLDQHIERLYDSARAIAMNNIPLTPDQMADAVVKTCKANKMKDGYIRLVVTRGEGELGLNPYLCEKPQIIIIASSIQMYPPELYEKGMAVVTVGTLRNNAEAVNPRIKSLNYLNNVLAKIEAINAGVKECILLNSQGFVAEASGDNIFAVRKNRLVTPPAWCGALEGITRNCVMRLAKEAGLEVVESVINRYDLYTAEEVFMTGTAAEIIAVTNIDRRPIGAGKLGPVTRDLTARFREFTKLNGTLIR